MRITVSLPEELARRVERLAALTRRSRSELVMDALEAHLAHHDDRTTAALDRLADEVDTRLDDFGARAALERTEW